MCVMSRMYDVMRMSECYVMYVTFMSEMLQMYVDYLLAVTIKMCSQCIESNFCCPLISGTNGLVSNYANDQFIYELIVIFIFLFSRLHFLDSSVSVLL